MTSVPSHLPRLNGNNYFIFLLALLMFSCATKKITATQKADVVQIDIKKPESPQVQEDSVTKKASVFDIDITVPPVEVPTIAKKDTNTIYNVAVILPFYLDQIPLGMYEDDSTKQLSGDSKIALAFYTGCQLARERFSKESLKANVYFVDDKDDSTTAVELFRQKPFPNVDYIIGPLSYTSIKAAAELAKSKQIPLISPIANSMYIKDNPYYFNAFPSLRSQYSFILEKTKAKFPDKMLEVIYDGLDSTAESIHIFKEIAANYYGYSKIKYTSLHTADDVAHAMASADTTSERVILIYSSKEVYIKSIVGKLKPVKNPLFIYTSAVAKNIKSLTDPRYPHTVYTVYPYNTDNPKYNLLSAAYEEKTKRKPEEAVAEGYDIMMHLLNMLDKKQALQDNTYNYTIDFDNVQSHFLFKPVLNKNGSIDYYDNSILYLYKEVSGNFIIATP